MDAELNLPDGIATETELDELLSRPTPGLIETMRRLDGDIVILGIAGKMGHSLGLAALRAIRAAGVQKRVIGVSRFSDPAAETRLRRDGVEIIRCDLLDPAAVVTLPQAKNVLFMAGRKFGTTGAEELTWAMNTVVPAYVAEHYAASRIVAFSTGCVYPLVPVGQGGCTEDDPAAPVGEYAQSCLGRERVFSYFSGKNGTPVCLLRLNYAIDLRYGVLHDLARRIWQGEPVSLNVAQFNLIWQGDANCQALQALEHTRCPAAILNITGPETVSVRQVAEELGRLLGKPVTFTGQPGVAAYLNCANRANALFGYPRVPLGRMLSWTAGWVRAGGPSLGKPTHFEVSTGVY